MKKAVELLERALGFINYVKDSEGEINDEGLEGDIMEFLYGELEERETNKESSSQLDSIIKSGEGLF